MTDGWIQGSFTSVLKQTAFYSQNESVIKGKVRHQPAEEAMTLNTAGHTEWGL